MAVEIFARHCGEFYCLWSFKHCYSQIFRLLVFFYDQTSTQTYKQMLYLIYIWLYLIYAASLDFFKECMFVPFGCLCYFLSLVELNSSEFYLWFYLPLFCPIWNLVTNNFFLSHLLNSRIHVRKFFSLHCTKSYNRICQSWRKYTTSICGIEKNTMAYLYFMELELPVDNKNTDHN